MFKELKEGPCDLRLVSERKEGGVSEAGRTRGTGLPGSCKHCSIINGEQMQDLSRKVAIK